MESHENATFTVVEKPPLSDQVITAAVGSVATILASVAISAGAQAVQTFRENRKAKKLAEEAIKTSEEE